MTIKGRLVALGLIATAGFAALVGVGWYSGQKTVNAAVQAETIRGQIRTINDMRLANIELVLAAMDTIVDREEGKVLPERAEIISDAIAFIRDNGGIAADMAALLGRPELTKTLQADLAEVEQAVTVDLPRLIENRASMEEFGALDDAIDGGGEQLNENLTALADLGNKTVRAELESVQQTAIWAETWLIGLAGAFMVLIGLITTLIVRYVSYALTRFGQDMGEIAGGNLDIEIEAETRKDEVGRMAESLVVFRNAAIEKAELERRADEDRSLSERERMEREKAKEEEARQIKIAVDALGNGLNRLADGDLTVRLNTPFR